MGLLDWIGRSRPRYSKDVFPEDAPIASLRYAVLDTELTSLHARSNRLLSAGAVAMSGSSIRISEQFYRVVNPGVEVPAKGVLVHELRPADIEAGEPIQRVLADLQAFVQGAVLVGHFIHIDLEVLRKEFGPTAECLANPAIDTARVHAWIVRRSYHSEDLAQRLERIDLASVARTYGLKLEGAHHALSDAFFTAQLWQRIMAKLPPLGVTTLGGLLRIGRFELS
jgi:DNA polymerase III epsilon subunit-like protein